MKTFSPQYCWDLMIKRSQTGQKARRKQSWTLLLQFDLPITTFFSFYSSAHSFPLQWGIIIKECVTSKFYYQMKWMGDLGLAPCHFKSYKCRSMKIGGAFLYLCYFLFNLTSSWLYKYLLFYYEHLIMIILLATIYTMIPSHWKLIKASWKLYLLYV